MTQKWQKSKNVNQCRVFRGTLIDVELKVNMYARDNDLFIVSSSITFIKVEGDKEIYALSVVFNPKRQLEY